MNSAFSPQHQEKLSRLGTQLSLTENHLKTHPLTSDKLTLIHHTVHLLNLQAQGTASGPLSSLLISAQPALIGTQQEESAMGFIAPSLNKFQTAIDDLINSTGETK